MFVYWSLFGAVGLGALTGQARTSRLLLLLAALIIALLIGLRFEVGGDWMIYERVQQVLGLKSFGEALTTRMTDPGYAAVNWLAHSLGGGLWLTNLVCAAIFTYGLYRLCSVQPEPWLALLIAIPYLVIVVAMGYTRQAVALGILMAGLASYNRGGGILKFAVTVAVAALFHRTAIILFPLVALAGRRSVGVNVLIAISVGLLLYNFFLESEVDRFVQGYIDARYESQGAFIRVLMSFSAALLFFLFSKKLGFEEDERRVWRMFSLASLGIFVLLFVLPSSTVVDRVGLYLLPLQIVVLARIPGRVLGDLEGRLAVIAYAFAVQYVWLNYAAHADLWLPYRNFAFQ